MAEPTTTVDESVLENADLTTTDIAPTQGDDPGAAADDKPNDGAATTDDKPDEKQDDPDAKASEAKDPDPAAKADDDKKSDDTPPEGDQNKTDDQPDKAERDRIARQNWLDRQRNTKQVAEQIDEHYAPKSEEDLVQEGLTPAQAQVEALRQEIAFKDQRTQIAELNSAMRAEAVEAINDFAVFNPNSKEFDAEFTKEVETAYKTAARLEQDEHGIITNAEVPLYDFYQRMANIYSRGASKGQQQGANDMQNMLSRTENPGGSSSVNRGSDLDELEEKLGDVVIT